jgi:tRNA A-37 threonylcarbamoyl transferase component Bud32
MATRDGGKRSSGPAVGAVATASASADPAASSGPSGSKEPSWKGKSIKRFRLVDELGEGAMGRVFVAEDQVLRRHVAMKLLPIKHRDGRLNHRTERLITEARAAATLEHPNVVTIYEIEQAGNYHYIAMELVEGGNLEKLVQLSGPMEIERACQLVAEAAEALAHAHKRGIVHRDVKPAKLLLTRSGRCKVCDFGLAMVEAPDNDATKLRCVGTPNFISPEVAMARGATDKSDIYSLGCTLFFLLTGRPPFPGTSSRQVMKMHVNDPLPDMTRWRPDVPPRLIEALKQACAKDPSKRFKDAEYFAKVLRTFTISTPNASHGTGVGPGSSSHLSAIEGLGLAATGAAMMPAPMPAPLSAPAPLPARAALPRAGWRDRFALLKGSPLMWAGAATVATALLIALGMWLVRPGPGRAEASSPSTSSSDPQPQSARQAQASPAPVAAPLLAVASASPASSGSALLNGTMEEDDTDDGLAGWFIHPRFKEQVQILREAGNRFIRLSNDDPAKTVFIDQKIDVDPGWKVVTISARMRATNFKRGKLPSQDARVAIVFKDEADKRVGGWPPVPSLRDDSPWIERVVTADVPAGAKAIYVQLAIFNATGTADFDDVKIVPQSPGGAAVNAVASAKPRAEEDTLATLGTMEDLDGKGGLRGWKIQERYKPWVTVLDESGNHFVRVVNPDTETLACFERKIDLDPAWKSLKVSARMRAIDFKAAGSRQDGRVELIFKDADGQRAGKYPTVPNVRADSPWATRTVTVDIPPDAKSLHLQCGIFNAKGTVDFDDIVIEPIK